jgi:hypothetical protein
LSAHARPLRKAGALVCGAALGGPATAGAAISISQAELTPSTTQAAARGLGALEGADGDRVAGPPPVGAAAADVRRAPSRRGEAEDDAAGAGAPGGDKMSR